MNIKSLFSKIERNVGGFVREILRSIESEFNHIRWFFQRETGKIYCEDPSNRVLAKTAIVNYRKSIVDFDYLSDIDRKKDKITRLF